MQWFFLHIDKGDGSHEPSVYNYMDTEIKTPPNYPPRPPMPASRHPAQAGIFQWIINCQSIQAPLRIRSGPNPGFCLIAVNPEDVAVIVVNVDAVVHRVVSCVYQFHCYQSFHLKWRLKAHGLILDLKNFRNRYNNHKMYHYIK